MTKEELIEIMAEAGDTTKAAASRVLDALTSSVTTALCKGDSVVLVGFGSFSTSERPARTGRNPRTGEAIEIAASTVVRFKAGKKLKEAVNKD